MEFSHQSSNQNALNRLPHDVRDDFPFFPWEPFAPIRHSFEVLMDATKEKIPDKHSRSHLTREALVIIGNHVVRLTEDDLTDAEVQKAVFW